MAITKPSRSMLSTGISDSSDATFLTADSSENATFAGNLTVSGNLTVTGTTTQVDTVTMNAQNAVLFEGATADAHETTLTTVDPTGDRTISLPNVSGTLPVLAVASATAITSTPTELNVMDGGTSATSITIADADRFVLNDNGTMLQVAASAVKSYIGSFDADAAQVFNESGAAVDFRIEGDSEQNLFFVDGSADKIGIGTSSPSTLLHLGGTAPGDSIIRQDSTSSGTNWEIGERAAGKWSIFEDDNDSIVATFTSTGNLAINGADNNIDRVFTIGTGTAKTSTSTCYPFAIQTNEASAAARLSAHYVGGASAADRKIYFQMEEEGVANDGHIIFNPYGGKVGIGSTNTPSNTLDIGSGHLMLANQSELRSRDTSSNEKTIVRVNSSNELEYGWSGAGDVKFMGGGSYTERMRIDTDGTVQIGNLRMNATGGNSQIEAGNVHFKVGAGIWMSGSSSLDLQLQVPVTGVGISTAAKLDAPTGDWFTNDGSVSSLSDSRLKTNIITLKDGLDIVNKLRPVTFQYDDTSLEEDGSKGLATANDTTRYGFIAQEVEEAAPHYVNSREGKIKGETVSDLKSTSMTRMIPMLVKAIQDLSQKIADRNQELTNLENRIETIEQRLI